LLSEREAGQGEYCECGADYSFHTFAFPFTEVLQEIRRDITRKVGFAALNRPLANGAAGPLATKMGKPRGRNERERMSQAFGVEALKRSSAVKSGKQ
jgi:hypothetical protein